MYAELVDPCIVNRMRPRDAHTCAQGRTPPRTPKRTPYGLLLILAPGIHHEYHQHHQYDKHDDRIYGYHCSPSCRHFTGQSTLQAAPPCPVPVSKGKTPARGNGRLSGHYRRCAWLFCDLVDML